MKLYIEASFDGDEDPSVNISKTVEANSPRELCDQIFSLFKNPDGGLNGFQGLEIQDASGWSEGDL